MKIVGSGVGWVSFHWLQKGLDDLSSRVASTGSTSPPRLPTASAPQHSTGAPCAAGGQAILGRRQQPCDMVGASDGDNQDNSHARQSDRMAQPGNPVASPSPSLQLWFLSLLQFYVQFFASFSSFFLLPALPEIKDHYCFFLSFLASFFSFSHALKPKVKTSYYLNLFCLFF